jgi:hypothetical protein
MSLISQLNQIGEIMVVLTSNRCVNRQSIIERNVSDVTAIDIQKWMDGVLQRIPYCNTPLLASRLQVVACRTTM